MQKKKAVLHFNNCSHFDFSNGKPQGEIGGNLTLYYNDNGRKARYVPHGKFGRDEMIALAEDYLLNIEDFDFKFLDEKKIYDLKFIQKNCRIKYIIVARDCYNLLASRFQLYDGYCIKIKEKMDLWKKHINSCLTNDYAGIPIIDINYNKWFIDKNYRAEICNKLEITFADKGKDDMPVHSSASSFDEKKMDGHAEDMKVLERWKQFKDNKEYVELIDDEMKKLSKEYFNFRPF
jgi:hypothetical protein